jgi:cytochrome P450
MSTNTVDLYDPDLYVDGPIHEIFAELRRTDPVHWQEMPGEPGYWLVLKHADLSWVARHPEPYSAETMGVVLEDPEPEQLALSRNMLLMMDPPRHGQYRKPLVNSFKAKVIAAMGDRIREICTEILDAVTPTSVPVTRQVACQIWRFTRWSSRLAAGSSRRGRTWRLSSCRAVSAVHR